MAYQPASLCRRGFRLAADALLSVEQTAYARSFVRGEHVSREERAREAGRSRAHLTFRAPIGFLPRGSAMNPSRRLSHLRVRPLAGNRARGWLTAGPFRIPCALGRAGIVRIKREGDKGTPAGRFRLLWGIIGLTACG